MIILVSMQSECVSLSNGASYSKSQKCDLRLVLSRWITNEFYFNTCFVFQWGILIGIGVSLLMILYPWGRPVVTVSTFIESRLTFDQHTAECDAFLSHCLPFYVIRHLFTDFMKTPWQHIRLI